MNVGLTLKPAELLKGSDKSAELFKTSEPDRMARNAKEYASFLMGTFAKIMLETCAPDEGSIDQEIMGAAFLGDALGEAMVESGVGASFQEDLLSSMMALQESGPKGPSDAQLNTQLIAQATMQQGGQLDALAPSHEREGDGKNVPLNS